MLTSGISIPNAEMTVADEFERKADDFAALAEAASTFEDVVRYRDLEHSYRLRAEQERVRQLSQLYAANKRDAQVVA